MTGAWGLPMQAELGGVRYAIRSDYRAVLDLLRWLRENTFCTWFDALSATGDGDWMRIDGIRR